MVLWTSSGVSRVFNLSTWEAEIRRIKVQGQPSKITRAKTAQAVEHLLCKRKALSLNPSPPKTNNSNNKTQCCVPLDFHLFNELSRKSMRTWME
jgi:hypothetical protein